MIFVLFPARTKKRCCLWHYRLCHDLSENVKRLIQHVSRKSLKTVRLINFVVAKFAKVRSHDGKQYRNNCRKENFRNWISFPLIFWDRCQLFRLMAIDTLFFTNNYSRYSAVYFLKSKEECLNKLPDFYAQVGTPTAIHSDFVKKVLFKVFKSNVRVLPLIRLIKMA